VNPQATQTSKQDPAFLRWLTAALLLAVLGILIAMALAGSEGRAPASPHSFRLGTVLIPLLATLALVLRAQERLRSFAFTAWVLAFVAAAMVWPQAFGRWLGYDLRFLIVPLVQIIMFGMGTKLSGQDFIRVLVMPRPVLIGVTLHFVVMPLTGYTIAKTFGFPPEVAAGVVLVGSVSSGVASNVIVYLARGNVALAVTITACSTLVSPLMTPFLMKTLAARLVPIDFVAMMIEVFSMVIVPVVAGLVAHRILYGSGRWFESAKHLGLMAICGFALAIGICVVHTKYLGLLLPLSHGAVIGFALIGLVALTKLAMSVWLHGPEDWMDKTLPFISMAGICLILAIITARSRDRLLVVGPALILAAVLHNAIGYILGYWLARAARLDESACRTIAVEVGMQNGGLATGLAMSVLQSADAALAPAIFGTWMNISGSILASWWRRRPVLPNEPVASSHSLDADRTSTREVIKPQ
jgi:BASS family bile acid:Na+ symporter